MKEKESIYRFTQISEDHKLGELMESYMEKTSLNLSHFGMSLITSPIDSFKEDFVDYIKKYGLSSFLKRSGIEECVLGKNMPLLDITSLVSDYVNEILDQLSTSQELIIVDSYLFKDNPRCSSADLQNRIANILNAHINKIDKIICITDSRNYDVTIKSAVETSLKSINSALTIDVQYSTDYHDRFWIANRNKGIVVGTSLNGLGNKMALIDFMDSVDIKDVVDDLKTNGLIV